MLDSFYLRPSTQLSSSQSTSLKFYHGVDRQSSRFGRCYPSLVNLHRLISNIKRQIAGVEKSCSSTCVDISEPGEY